MILEVNALVRHPRAEARAAAYFETHGLATHTPKEQNDILAKLRQDLPERDLRLFRKVMRDDTLQPLERVERIVALVDEVGLAAPEVPDVLPPVEESEIHPVCWAAVLPKE